MQRNSWINQSLKGDLSTGVTLIHFAFKISLQQKKINKKIVLYLKQTLNVLIKQVTIVIMKRGL